MNVLDLQNEGCKVAIKSLALCSGAHMKAPAENCTNNVDYPRQLAFNDGHLTLVTTTGKETMELGC